MSARLERHLEDCYSVRTKTDATLTRLEGKLDAITQLPMRTLKWVGGLVIGAAVTMLVQNFMLHQETSQTTTQAVKEAVTAQAIVAAKRGTPP